MAAGANGSKGATERPARRLRIPLSLKFAAVTVTLVGLLLLAAAAISLWQAFTEAERSALAVQQQRAEALAGRIGSVLDGLQTQLAWTAQPGWRAAGIEQQRADFARMLTQFPAVTELFDIDGNGAEQLKVSRFAPDSVASQTSHANEPRFQETVKARTWFGPVYVRNGAELSGTVGVAHQDGGATIAEIDLAFLNDLVKAASGEDVQAFIVDGVGRLIGDAERNPVVGDNDLSGLPQVVAALTSGGTGTSTDAVLEGDAGSALAAFAKVPGAGWTAIVQTPNAVALRPFWSLLGQTALLALAGLAIALLAGISMARRVSVPIRKLQASAELLGEGDLAQRVDVHRRDEIGALADRFNTMASRLQQNRKGLEAAADDQAQGLDIAQQQHGLTIDMLKTISRTDYRLERVLDTLIGSAVRLTEANVGAVWLREGDAFRLAAQLGHTNDWVEAARKTPFTAGSETHAMAAAAAFSGQVINVDDVLRDVRFAGDYGERPAYSDERSALALPLKHAGKVVAVFALSRGDPLPFTERQVSLAQDFSDQALIAVRHMLLLDEVETRDRKLALSSDEQAAMVDIARLIAKSPANAKPALEKIARSAARFLDAPYCHIELWDGQHLQFRAAHGLAHEAIELLRSTAEPSPAAAEALETGTVAEIPDLQAGEQTGALSAMLGSKSLVAVPLLKEGMPVGVLTVEREETGALPARQVELLKTFADQAAIAIESAHLSDELRTRTSKLASALERETATGTLLQTVSRTDYDLGGVLTGLAARAIRECGADEAQFFRLDGEVLHDSAGAEAAAQGHAGLARRIVSEPAAVNVPDIRQNSELAGRDAANRSMLGLPLLAKGVVVGAMTLSRRQAQPFDEEQARLAAELADQAALAVAGMQLPAELAERTTDRDEWRQRHATDTDAAERRRVAEVDEARHLHVTEVAETRERYETELGEARRLHETDVAEARSLHATDVAETRERYETELAEARRLHADEVAERTAERDEWRQRHATDTDAAEQRRVAEIDEANRLHSTEIDEARRLHAADVQEAQQRREADLAEAERLRLEELDGTIKAHAAELAERLTAHAGELAETNTKHADELAEARSQHAAELGGARDLHAGDLELARLQRTATADALKHVADPSAGLDAVLQAIVGSAVRACGAGAGVLFGRAGDRIEAWAMSGLPEEDSDMTLAALRDALATKVVAQGKPLHLANPPTAGTAFGAALGVPLVKDGAAQGVLVLLGETNAPSDEVAVLAESFADQAVIAIETERLLELAALRADQLDEARRFREAAARVLGVVGNVGTDPQQALDAVVATAAELCRAEAAELSLAEDDTLRPTASAGIADGDVSVARRAIADRRVVHVASESADAAAPGATLAVPLMLGGKAAGALILRREAAFSEREIELATTLAAQAAIAVAKARLAVALAERNRSLDQALNERESTARMLATLGRTRFGLRDVLDTLARSAAELGGADIAAICLQNGGALENAGSVGFARTWPGDGRHPEAASLAEHAMREATPLLLQDDPAAGNLLAVPVISVGKAIGALVMSGPSPFGDRDAAVASTLADQAAIAIENVRLLDEVAARAAEVNDGLRHQAATAGGLNAISRSAFDLDNVLSGLTASAAALCAGASTIHLLRDGAYHLAAATGLTPERLAEEQANPSRPGRASWVGRTALDKAVIHVPDAASDIDYPEMAKTGGALLSVPLLRDGAVVGVFTLTRPAPGAFSERQIGLIQGFADQAVIAAETVRLADEVAARTAEVGEILRQQTAVAYVLRTMGRSAFELDRVLGTLAASAATLCNAASSEIYRFESGGYRLSASTGTPQSQPALDGWIQQAAHEKSVIHVPHPGIEDRAGSGAALCVPLLREDAVVGVFALTRPESFTEHQVELVRTFADQAVIAVEGARLADAAQASADELAESLRNLHGLQKRVGDMERLATLGQTTSGIAGEIRSSLDSLKEFSVRSDRLVNDIRMVLENAVIDIRVRDEVEELGDTLKANLDKVVEFGKRADSVVVNVLRLDEGKETGVDPEHRPVEINALVDESLGIAWHAAREEHPNVEVRLERAYDPAAGKIDVRPQEVARALLYVFTNGFQAAARRSATANGSGYQPALAASTRNLGDAVEITIRDNGVGILPEVKAKIFNPFFTTRPPGEGTGLGLSLAHDIIVTQHSGAIEVDTELGSFTEFRIVLPRGGGAPAKTEVERHASATYSSVPDSSTPNSSTPNSSIPDSGTSVDAPLMDVLSALRN